MASNFSLYVPKPVLDTPAGESAFPKEHSTACTACQFARLQCDILDKVSSPCSRCEADGTGCHFETLPPIHEIINPRESKSEQEWNNIKETFRTLYLDRRLPLEEIRRVLATQGFRATYVPAVSSHLYLERPAKLLASNL